MKIEKLDYDCFYDFARKNWARFYDSQELRRIWRRYHFGAFDEKRLVGVIDLEIKDKTTQIENLIVDQTRRKNGVGSKLLSHAEDVSKRERCDQIVLLTADIHDDAKEFYLRRGFEIVSTIPDWVYHSTWYAMRLRL